MKRNIDQRYSRLSLLFCFLVAFALSCEQKDWKDHYDEGANRGDQAFTLLQAIRENGYPAYADALERLGFSQAVNSGTAYTIFVMPDEQFRQATQGKSDQEISACLLNIILPGAYRANEFTQSAYQPVGGDELVISMKNNTISNLHQETISITKKEITCSNGILYEISSFLPQYPDVRGWLRENGYLEYLGFIDQHNTVDSTYIVEQYGFSREGLVSVTTYPKEKFEMTGKALSQMVFVVPAEGMAGDKTEGFPQQVAASLRGAAQQTIDTTISKYFPGFRDNIFDRNVGTAFVPKVQKAGLVLLSGDTIFCPANLVKQEVKLTRGNKIILADTLFNSRWLPAVKEQYWNFSTDRTNAEFVGNGFKDWGNWCNYVWVNQEESARSAGDKVVFSFPAKTLYTVDYMVELRSHNNKNWPEINLYVNGRLLGSGDMKDKTETNRWDEACEDNGNLKFPVAVSIGNYTQEVEVTLEIVVPGTGGEAMAPYSVLFKIKE